MACVQCGCGQAESLWTCSACDETFCNCETHCRKSHLVYHAAIRHHFAFVEKATDRRLECETCQQNNIFLLRIHAHTGVVSCREHSGNGVYYPLVKDDVIQLSPSMYCCGDVVNEKDIVIAENRVYGQEMETQSWNMRRAPTVFRSCYQYFSCFRAMLWTERNTILDKNRLQYISEEHQKSGLSADERRALFKKEDALTRQSYKKMLDAVEMLHTMEANNNPLTSTTVLLAKVKQPEVAAVNNRRYSRGYNNLNCGQQEAVRMALHNKWTLIQGPPGTGKTTTAAVLVAELVSERKGIILVCAPTNVSCDVIALKIGDLGIEPMRMYAECRDGGVNDLAAHFSSSRFDDEEAALADSRVICCTLAAAGDKRIKDLKFAAIVIDEAAQATEPATLLPIVLFNSVQVSLFGDQRQLRAIVIDDQAKAAGLGRSMFERLMDARKIPSLCLVEQYRMHPAIRRVASYLSYAGLLSDGRQVEALQGYAWPNIHVPMVFFHTDAYEERGEKGHSYINYVESTIVVKVVKELFRTTALQSGDVGVITFYAAQKQLLANKMVKAGFRDVEVATVDAFQGREKSVIIISCVRSNSNGRLDFVADANRLNVAITRAANGIVIVGNAGLLECHEGVWRAYLQQLENQQVVINYATLEQRKPRARIAGRRGQ